MTTPDPVALITGSSSGIGLAAAKMLAEQGFRVVMVARTESKLKRSATSVGELAHPITADLSDPEEARRIVRETLETFGRLDALINNAGFAPLHDIAETDAKTLEKTYAVNAISPAAAIAEAWPVMKKQGSGVIVNVSTVATRDPFPGFFAYAASKAATNLMIQSVNNEGQEHGIIGFCVAPGAVETGMLRSLFSTDMIPQDAALAPEDVGQVIADCVLRKRDQDAGNVIWVERETAGADA